MEERLSRRGLLRRLGGMAGAGALSALFFKRAEAGDFQTMDYCYWTKSIGPMCVNGQVVEWWCYRCCAGLECETLRCEMRVVGSC